MLENKAMLSQLHIQQWSGRKFDADATSQVVRNNGARKNNAGRFNKLLFPSCDDLKKISKMSSAMRTDFHRHTLPWQDMGGIRLMPTRVYQQYVRKLEESRNVWDALVDDFITMYSYNIDRAKDDLGDLFDINDYPDESVVAQKFDINFKIDPVPSNDFRVELGEDLIASIREDINRRNQQAFKDATMDAWKQLRERVHLLHERISVPDSVFRDTLVGNLRDTCDMLRVLNFADDPDLEKCRRKVEKKLAGYSPDSLRHNSSARKSATKDARKLIHKMDKFMRAA